MLDKMSEELYNYLNTVISDWMSGGGRDLFYKKWGVCVDRWLEPNTYYAGTLNTYIRFPPTVYTHATLFVKEISSLPTQSLITVFK